MESRTTPRLLVRLPADVKAWIELWLGRQSTAFALVALFDQPEKCMDQVKNIQNYLARVAKRGEMEFFAQPDVWPRDETAPVPQRWPSGPTRSS